jgi:hypothetical protein
MGIRGRFSNGPILFFNSMPLYCGYVEAPKVNTTAMIGDNSKTEKLLFTKRNLENF